MRVFPYLFVHGEMKYEMKMYTCDRLDSLAGHESRLKLSSDYGLAYSDLGLGSLQAVGRTTGSPAHSGTLRTSPSNK